MDIATTRPNRPSGLIRWKSNLLRYMIANVDFGWKFGRRKYCIQETKFYLGRGSKTKTRLFMHILQISVSPPPLIHVGGFYKNIIKLIIIHIGWPHSCPASLSSLQSIRSPARTLFSVAAEPLERPHHFRCSLINTVVASEDPSSWKLSWNPNKEVLTVWAFSDF